MTVAGAAFGILGALLAVPAAVVVGILVKELWFRRHKGGPKEAHKEGPASWERPALLRA